MARCTVEIMVFSFHMRKNAFTWLPSLLAGKSCTVLCLRAVKFDSTVQVMEMNEITLKILELDLIIDRY